MLQLSQNSSSNNKDKEMAISNLQNLDDVKK